MQQDLSQDVPASLGQGELRAIDQQHPCGEWLAVGWSGADGPGEVTVVAVERTAHQLAAGLAAERAQLRAEIRTQLRKDVEAVLRRLAEPFGEQESREDREDEVTTGSDAEPGVYREEQWLAWAYDPTGSSSEPITVVEQDLLDATS